MISIVEVTFPRQKDSQVFFSKSKLEDAWKFSSLKTIHSINFEFWQTFNTNEKYYV